MSSTQSIDHSLHNAATINESRHHNTLNGVEETEQAQLFETLQNIVSLDASTLPQTTISQPINANLLQASAPIGHMSMTNMSIQSSLPPFSVPANNNMVSTWLNNNLLKVQSRPVASSGILPPVTELHPALRAASNFRLLELNQSSVIPSCPTSIQPVTQNILPISENSNNMNKSPVSNKPQAFTIANNENNSLHHISVSKVKLPNIQQPLVQQSLPLNSLPNISVSNGNQPFEMLTNNLVTSQSMEPDSLMNSLVSTSSVTNLLSNNLMGCSPSLIKAFGLNAQDENLNLSANTCNNGMYDNIGNQTLQTSVAESQYQKQIINHSNQLSNDTQTYFTDLSTQALTLSTPILTSSGTASDRFAKHSPNLNAGSSDDTTLLSSIEETRCFKCKFCTFISLHKHLVISHLKSSHHKNLEISEPLKIRNEVPIEVSKMPDNNLEQGNILIERDNVNYNSEATISSNLINQKDINNTPVSEETDNRFLCGKCRKGFSSLEACRHHMVSDHSVKWKRVRLERIVNTQNSGVNKSNGNQNVTVNKSGVILLELNSKGTTPTTKAINQKFKKSRENKNEPETKLVIAMKRQRGEVTSRQKSWQRKLKREYGSYICEFKGCNIRFRQLDNLEYHCKCHVSGCSAFNCPECGNRFEHWGNIAGHLWRHHSVDLELHACDQCSFRTYSLSKLENLHKRIHQEERPYLCDTCGKGFKTNKQLRNHQVIHMEKSRQGQFRSGECHICHRHFSDKRMLRLHLDTVHNKIRPFLCNYCGYTASCKSTLKMHMRQHTGEKPFSCDMCDYRTSDHNSLRRHKMRHSGEKPYKCPYCTYACIQSSTYKTHLKNKHPGRDDGLMFSCSLCSFRTIKRDTYVTHMTGHQSGNGRDSAVSVGPNTDSRAEGSIPLVEVIDIGMMNGTDDHLGPSQFVFGTLD
ncbi:uncharacterized protein [Centruroides vittatus]|uniref:uncharacterized protein n=1 Tax=Centruroides vittatus TaxID=120091 RepID=UPI00350F1656